MSSRFDDEVRKFIRDNFKVDNEGHISSEYYAQLHITIREVGKGNGVISSPVSHLVWFLTRGEWPKKGYVIDHIDDNPLNNSPGNLAEVTVKENQAKRKGKRTRAYGRTKYGHGIFIWYDKKNKKYCVNRRFPVGEIREDKDHIMWIGWADSLEEAEVLINEYLEKLNAPISDMFD